jgi:hypothetical protein
MRAIRFVLGLLLIPVCVALTRAAAALVVSVRPASGGVLAAPAWAFGGGCLLWVILFFALPRQARAYVLAHELSHALWGAAMGASVVRMRVGREGGSVTLSKSNFLITLAPYFFPLYTILAIGAYYLLAAFFAVEAYALWWLGLVGFTWAFHVTFTLSSLLRRQSDIQEYGHLLSYVVIYAFNVLGICLWVVLVTSATMEQMVAAFCHESAATALTMWRAAQAAWTRLRPAAPPR